MIADKIVLELMLDEEQNINSSSGNSKQQGHSAQSPSH